MLMSPTSAGNIPFAKDADEAGRREYVADVGDAGDIPLAQVAVEAGRSEHFADVSDVGDIPLARVAVEAGRREQGPLRGLTGFSDGQAVADDSREAIRSQKLQITSGHKVDRALGYYPDHGPTG